MYHDVPVGDILRQSVHPMDAGSSISTRPMVVCAKTQSPDDPLPGEIAIVHLFPSTSRDWRRGMDARPAAAGTPETVTTGIDLVLFRGLRLRRVDRVPYGHHRVAPLRKIGHACTLFESDSMCVT